MENYLDKLNEKQREAVTTLEGPVLVLAGAGSGKTTVLANRIAYIMQNTYARPWNILAITFTNKAAKEMKNRIEKIVGSEVESMWVGTFHSICVRMLRTSIDRLGYAKDFVIYDTLDTKTVVKECMKELNISEKTYAFRYVQKVISNAKNASMTPEELAASDRRNPSLVDMGRIYQLYNKKLKKNNAVDFDDIIMLMVKILKENPDIAEKYQAQFQYILVDEYQDTNNSQYELIKILAKGYGNLCVVGDDDQSIYKFRGANIENILDFDKDYTEITRVDLEQNYRSTSAILDAANAVIAKNSKRLGKNLWTDKGLGEKISTYVGLDEREEAKYISREICRYHNKEHRAYNDCAILYRTNAQSRALEDVLMKEGVPYKILAGLRFYDRKEIKDAIAYLRLIYNYDESVSFNRIINEPKRKIGTATLDKIQAHAQQQDISNFEVIENVHLYSDLKSAAPKLKAFCELIKDLRKAATELPIDKFVEKVLSDSGYLSALAVENTTESHTRLENLDEFIGVVSEYAKDETTSGSLGEFLETVTLRSDTDDYDEAEDYVVLMTIHSAKGLEFPIVFLAGMEERIFPAERPDSTTEDLEEERRLCYVAITRAKEKLYLTRAMSRFKYGSRMPSDESKFMREIPNEYLESSGGVISRVTQTAGRMGINIRSEKTEVYQKPAEKLRTAVSSSHFAVGDRVMHRKFGEGKVVSAQPVGNDFILVIDFKTAGTKRLMAAFAKLEKLN